MKVCNRCKKEISDDSKFCPYCGSSDISLKEEKITIVKEQNVNFPKQKTYLTEFIICLVIAVIFGMIIFTNSIENNNDSSNSYTYNCKYDTEWHREVQEIANQDVSTNFFADNYFLTGTNNTLRIYCTLTGCTVNWEGNYYGTKFDDNDFSDWYIDDNGLSYFDITINVSKDAYGIIVFTNDKNSETFKVFVSGK